MKATITETGPLSVHVTNLTPKQAKFLGSLVTLFADPQYAQHAGDLLAGTYVVGVDLKSGEGVLIQRLETEPALN